jgi:hypothetical protein
MFIEKYKYTTMLIIGTKKKDKYIITLKKLVEGSWHKLKA